MKFIVNKVTTKPGQLNQNLQSIKARPYLCNRNV